MKQFLTSDTLIVDTETTGLGQDAEIIEISVINGLGDVLLDTLIKPRKPVPAAASAIHGITNPMLEGKSNWCDIHQDFISLLASHQHIAVYNLAYDWRLIQQTSAFFGVGDPFETATIHPVCIMLAYAEFYGQWDSYRDTFKWQRLSHACQQQGIAVPDNAHRALADCRMTLDVMRAMAGAQ